MLPVNVDIAKSHMNALLIYCSRADGLFSLLTDCKVTVNVRTCICELSSLPDCELGLENKLVHGQAAAAETRGPPG